MQFKRHSAGVYEVVGTDLQILKDGYEPLRDSGSPGREHEQHFDHMHLGATEVVWIVMRVQGGHEDNLGMFDTLREAKAFVERKSLA